MSKCVYCILIIFHRIGVFLFILRACACPAVLSEFEFFDSDAPCAKFATITRLIQLKTKTALSTQTAKIEKEKQNEN